MRQALYYKMRQLLQNATIFLQNAIFITKCDVYYKLRQCIRSYSELRVKPLLFHASQNSLSRLERNMMREVAFFMCTALDL